MWELLLGNVPTCGSFFLAECQLVRVIQMAECQLLAVITWHSAKILGSTWLYAPNIQLLLFSSVPIYR